MYNKEQYEILQSGVAKWNKWREENSLTQIHLDGADLREANLRKANLQNVSLISADLGEASLPGVNLSEANLCGADLNNTDLWEADLSGANLKEAELYGAYMYKANLREANLLLADINEADLTGVDLRGTNLTGAYLNDTEIKEARFDGTLFGNTSINRVRNLDKCIHSGPSYLDFKTIQSNINIPISFLKKCGLSDVEIEYSKLNSPDLSNEEITDITYEINRIRAEKPIQMKHVMISYSHADTTFVNKICNRLDADSIRYWRDINDAPAGPLEKSIDKAIAVCSAVLLVLSENSVNSDYVEYEAQETRRFEKKSNEHKLLPIALDDSWKDCDWSKVLRNQIMKYNILDFSRQNDESSFEDSMKKLYDGLHIYYSK